jgi:hypothetical protein
MLAQVLLPLERHRDRTTLMSYAEAEARIRFLSKVVYLEEEVKSLSLMPTLLLGLNH